MVFFLKRFLLGQKPITVEELRKKYSLTGDKKATEIIEAENALLGSLLVELEAIQNSDYELIVKQVAAINTIEKYRKKGVKI